jgi:ABC-type Fe3+ transport system permease subunit
MLFNIFQNDLVHAIAQARSVMRTRRHDMECTRAYKFWHAHAQILTCARAGNILHAHAIFDMRTRTHDRECARPFKLCIRIQIWHAQAQTIWPAHAHEILACAGACTLAHVYARSRMRTRRRILVCSRADNF